MNCINCNSELGVFDQICTDCRKLGITSHQFKKQNANIIIKILRELPLKYICIIFLCFILSYKYDFLSLVWTKRTLPGQLAAEEPIQSAANIRKWTHKDYLFEALASYDITARVLLKSNYWFSPGSDLAPIDITLGWGPMSDQAVLDKISLSSCNRCYNWRTESEPPIPPDEINRNAANVHMIPKNDLVLKKLQSLSASDIVNIQGYLVHISRADGYNWTSSLTREDSGGGACEVLWVESVVKIS